MTLTTAKEDGCSETTTPSAEFITAISEFFETDPSDLLAELGYYIREPERSPLSAAAIKA